MVLGNTWMKKIFSVFFRHSLHLLKGLLTIYHFLVLMGHICLENIKWLWWLLWDVMWCNNQLFPLAFVIIEGKNTNSWNWFLACIKVGVTQRKGLCLISDHHLDIIATVNETYSRWTKSDSYHKFCMCYLMSNFNTRFKDKTLKDLICRFAMERKVKKCISYMDTIGWINVEARYWLK